MTGLDPFWLLGSAAGIGAGFILSYLLGRWHGMAAAYESLRPIEPRDGEALGDCLPAHLVPVSHVEAFTDARA